MAKRKESPKEADIGSKRYKAMKDKCNTFYDKYMAGKTNPKTGEYYHDIGFKAPTNLGSKYIGSIECLNKKCRETMPINNTTAAIICSKCKLLLSISRNRETGEITVTSSLDKDE